MVVAAISAIVTATALATLVPTTATAATPTAPAMGTVTTDFGGHPQHHVVDATLAAQINSGDWKDLTTAQLASAGIVPGMSYGAAETLVATTTAPTAVATTTGTTAPAAVHPDTGSGCNFNAVAGSMCIYVYGTGLTTTSWDSSVANPLGIDTCTYAGYWINDTLALTSNEVCGDGEFWAYDSGTITWPNQTQLCNTWVNFGGKPCLVVHN